MEKTKIDTSALSFFRFFLAITIIYLHYGISDYAHMKNYARAGSIIVFFYMVSGFVLFLNYRNKGTINFKNYLIKRFTSIAPLYYFGLMLSLAILVYMDRVSYGGLFLSFFGLQSWAINYQHYLNPPSWFVSGLLFFYLVFPVLFSRITRTAPDARKLMFRSFLIWLFSVAILNTFFNPGFFHGYFSNYFEFIDCFPLAHFCSFFMGVCGAYYITEGKKTYFEENSLKSILSTAGILVLFILTLTVHYKKEVGDFMQSWLPYEAGLYAPIVLLLIMNLSTERNLLTRFFSSKFFILLGSISYALYILQMPVYHIYLKFISRPMALSPIEDFIFFIGPFIAFAGILTAIEGRTIKRLFKKYFDKEAKLKISPDLGFGPGDRAMGQKAVK